ncbi:YARHG domain-containing protein [Prevotella sp. 10(H)]|uniref:YARHG domain-containing protein n=1 Tax=Prevotella sp. 10(H) TaxID=1158294 RepID=UPI0004A6CD10|nr:YARHG domain-containing protein [Prevotella sp. 10(H)]
MKYLTHLLLFFFLSIIAYANDGAYYVSGNQLIPVTETDITVKKEILSIKRKNRKQVEVDVYYEFYNPGNTKQVVVGFEAFSPGGDVNPNPKNGRHPNIYDFTVKMNESSLPYKVAMVKDSVYYQNGKFKGITRKQMNESLEDHGWMSADFFYVYHFNADFKKGLNTLKHTYTCDLSTSVDYAYSFDYILTAAIRWGNKQIDDFTLIIDMGEFQDFYIDDNPFRDNPKWDIHGNKLSITSEPYIDYRETPEQEKTRTRFMIRNGEIIYKAENFRPKAELAIRSFRAIAFTPTPFNYEETPYISYTLIESEDYSISTTDETSKKILKNLPFARRGYIFSSPELKEYYSGQIWYKPDSNYKAVLSELPKEEQDWVMRYSK